jgi:hypothetical protein
MERTLVLSAFAVGCLGWLFGMLGTWSGRNAAPTGRQTLPRVALGACLFTPVIVFIATLPSHPPFASGQGLGRGFVLGALGALLAGWLAFRTEVRSEGEGDRLQSAAAATGPYFLAGAVVAIPLLWMQPVLTDALLGAAIGWFVNSFLLCVIPQASEPPQPERRIGAILSAGFAITLAITVAMADYRGGVRFASALAPVSWRAIMIAFGASVPFLMLLCALPASWIARLLSRLPLAGVVTRVGGSAFRSDAARNTLVRVWRVIPAAVLLLVVARLFSLRIEHRPPLLQLAGIGIVMCLLAWWLTNRRGIGTDGSASADGTQQQNTALAVIVVMCGVMAAYQMFSGVGVGIVLLSAWLVAALAWHGSSVSSPEAAAVDDGVLALPALLNFGLGVELYRFISVRFGDDLRGAGLTDHYALFGVMIGALLPVMLAGYLLKRRAAALPGDGEMVGRAIIAGALVLATPFVLVLLFGVKCELALYFGLALAGVLPLFQAGASARSQRDMNADVAALLLPSLLALAAALALAQWTHHIVPMALYARAEKLRLIKYLAGAIVILLLASDYIGRYRDRRLHSGLQSDSTQAGRAAQ